LDDGKVGACVDSDEIFKYGCVQIELDVVEWEDDDMNDEEEGPVD
jgi:hypothetical protein